MSSINELHVYNCTASILELNISLLIKLNRSEFLIVSEEALGRSTQRDILRDALSDCIFGIQEPPFDLPWWQKLTWSLIYAIILLIATGGNIIVMWIVLAHRRMRTVTNYFLVNLSLADLMMSLLNCAFNFIFLLNSSWPFGAIYCIINNFVAHVTVASSVFTLVVISFDRYMAIMHPLKRHMSRRRTILTLILIWAISSILAIPNLLYSTTKQKRYLNGKTRISCFLAWPDGGYLNSKTGYFYNLLFLSMTYLIPIVVMAICYTLMGRKLWGSKFIGELTHNQKESMKSKRKVVKMFISIVTIFAICWFPYQGFFIFIYHYQDFIQTSYVQHVYLSFYWLAMSNSMVNPIIYYWMNNRFRVYFQLIICKCCCALDRTNVNSPQMREFIELHRSDQERCRCGRLQTTSIRWRHSGGESHIQTFRMNSRSTYANRSTKDDTVII
ncbi:tachykinin-like peptides receptor 86C [Vespa mandarinia]|uniref:tachykinin-like peptides receptor 86C n=1 Tax=Vespa mandarinia TaxID=7446 RepID=UPI0016097D85|nr:tachykinin-like peptides receptor 86C [Vespa mandarinia]XP_035731003.1 tachykinin-like peptides receptor 86C [Vespa mandarinia]